MHPMYPFPYNDRRSAISELDEAITFYQKMKKELAEEGKKKDSPPRKNSAVSDVMGNMILLTVAVFPVGGLYIWLTLKGIAEIISVIHTLPR